MEHEAADGKKLVNDLRWNEQQEAMKELGVLHMEGMGNFTNAR
jgi:hypothetical protein